MTRRLSVWTWRNSKRVYELEGASESAPTIGRLANRPSDLPEQPRAGVGPVILGGARGNAERVRCFVIGHADEVTQLHQFRFDLVLDCEFVERFADGEELVVIGWSGHVHFLNVHALLAAAVAD